MKKILALLILIPTIVFAAGQWKAVSIHPNSPAMWMVNASGELTSTTGKLKAPYFVLQSNGGGTLTLGAATFASDLVFAFPSSLGTSGQYLQTDGLGGTSWQTVTVTNITGNAGTVTNGVYTTGVQTIGGAKTFTSPTTISTSGGNIPNACYRTSANVASGSLITVSCGGGEVVMGGGCTSTAVQPMDNYPSSSTAWSCRTTTASNITAYAICCRY